MFEFAHGVYLEIEIWKEGLPHLAAPKSAYKWRPICTVQDLKIKYWKLQNSRVWIIWILTVPRQRARNDTKSQTFSTLWSTSSPSGKKLPSNPRKNSDLDLLCSSYTTTSPFYKMATPGKPPPGQQQKRQFIFFWAYYLYVVKVQKSPKVKKQTTGSRGSWPLLSCMVGAMPLYNHHHRTVGKTSPFFPFSF